MLATLVWLSDDGGPTGPEAPAGETRTEKLPTPMVDATDGEAAAPTGDMAHRNPGVPQSADTTTALPEGYSVVQHRGRMAEGGAMARTDDERTAGPDWLRAGDGPQRLAAQAASADRPWTFGYVELASAAGRTSLERSLADAGARVVGSSGRLIRARLPGGAGALRDIAALPDVAGLGAVPAAVKLRGFDVEGGAEADGGPLPVFVTLMEEDGDGGWGRSLEALGATVGAYDADIRAYTATATREVARLLAESDFVAAVEPIREVTALNDTAVPAMGADAIRAWDGTAGMFSGTGGASVPVGVMDTGLNLNHPDIREGRESICGANFAPAADDGDARVQDEDLWIDAGLHGTHVTGTIVGNGADDPRFAGMAPSVRHIRFAKVLHSFGPAFEDGLSRGMNYLARASGCGGASAKPALVNMSLSNDSRYWEGRSAGERKLDATVWGHGQLYVVAQSNDGEYSFSNYAAAKNSLAVAAVHDTGGHATFTSVGPTADGRLAPLVSGTGVHVHSARGGGSAGGYERFNGTSMAAPSVSGVAALLMDAAPEHKGRPALARARLMASAIRPDAWLDDADAFPADNGGGPGTLQAVYGLGKVSARTAILDRDRADGWRSGSATVEPEDGEYAFVDIDVPAGASRLDLVMTWDEPPADAISDSVLNDLDLWLDRGGDCGGGECGERSSTSRIDNVEWIVVRDPEPGTYRAKVVARAVYTAAPRAALAWTVIRGPSTPQLRIEATPSTLGAESVRDVRVEVSVDGYVAAGTQLRIDCRGPDGSGACDGVAVDSVAELREDGSRSDLEIPGSDDAALFGHWFSLGEVDGARDILLRLRAGEEPAVLRLSADAWNAKAALAWVEVAGGEAPGSTMANDDFEDAQELSGSEGSAELDLLAGTPEPGEPEAPAVDGPFMKRPGSSAWYEWEAPASGQYHFGVMVPEREFLPHASVEVFEGDRLASLRSVGDGRSVSFRAGAGESFGVRVATFARAERATLHWSSGRPANDDFVNAELLEGANGRVEGTSAGATLEKGESWGRLHGTTWYRWTAPEDGDWLFNKISDRGNAQVLVFEGDGLGSLRLVSSLRHADARLLVRAGAEYRIAQAQFQDVRLDGGRYVLEWWPAGDEDQSNDRFAAATELEGGTNGGIEVRVDDHSSVEPGEPVETGVRTRWWKWEPPLDGRYTWRIGDAGVFFDTLPSLQIRAFAGDSLGELRMLGGAGPGAPYEFAVDAVAGETLYFAAGFPADGPDAYDVREASATLAWGVTPPNDGMAGAVHLDTGYGSVSGSNRHATTDADVRVDVVGRSAVWWTFEAPADGWYRFSADGEGGPWAVTVHDEAGHEVSASSRWQRSEGTGAEVLFYAAAGSRHAVSLGTAGGGTGGDFTLGWDTAEPPLWLRYAGRLADGSRDGDGNPVEIRMPGELAILPDGGPWTRSVLYLASGIGLQVFSRDPDSGDLTMEYLLEGDLSRASLALDADNRRLLTHDCGTWRSHAFNVEGTANAHNTLDVADDPANCGRLLLDGGRGFVYRIGESGVDAFSWDGNRALSFEETYDIAGLRGATLDGAGRIYAVGDDGLLALERDAGTGSLSGTATGESLAVSGTAKVPLAVDAEDERLFAVDDEGTHVFALGDPLAPDRLGSLPRSHREHPFPWLQAQDRCGFAAIRGGLAVDVFCRSQSFTAEWDPDGGTLSETDGMDDRTPDRFNNLVPDFGLPAGMSASTDGRHVYVSTPMHGILTFERVATPQDSQRLALPDGPDLAVISVSVSDPAPLHGRLFRVNATVRNRGNAGSDSSTLRFYRSSDATIDPAGDDEEATRNLRRLDPGGEANLVSSITAPSSGGTYYYGVCVDAVDEEPDTANNCSRGVQVRVATPDLVVETPAVDDDAPEAGASFTLSVTVRNRGDGRSGGAATLRYYRSADSRVSSGDTEVGTDVVGILQPGADNDESIRLTAPSSAGTYYYGACVDAVDGESDTANNCSGGVEVEVSESGGGGGGTDDHGDTFADATLLSIPSTTAGELEEGGDRDYFRAEVNRAGTYSVETTGGTDTYGRVFDGDRTLLDENDDGGSGVNFRIEGDLQPGTYYVEVRGFSPSTTGAYQVVVRRESAGGGDAVATTITECSGESDGTWVDATIGGNVRANRSVSSVRVEGSANGFFLGSRSLGDMSRGGSEDFTISGRFADPGATTIDCEVETTWFETVSAIGQEQEEVRTVGAGSLRTL
ncbi:MAG: S8 family serine peptidase [Gammaproteobacteria bacterium]|nr:S8 family serine peptidase [Gammaproteobacteria bacterium]